MQLNVWNDLAKAKRRWTEKKVCVKLLCVKVLSVKASVCKGICV